MNAEPIEIRRRLSEASQAVGASEIIESLLRSEFGIVCQVRTTYEQKTVDGDVVFKFFTKDSMGIRYLILSDVMARIVDSLIDSRIFGNQLISSDPLMWYLFDGTSKETPEAKVEVSRGELRTTILMVTPKSLETSLFEWKGLSLRPYKKSTENSLEEINQFIGPVSILREQGIFSIKLADEEDKEYIQRLLEVAEMWRIKYLKRHKQYLYFSKPESKVFRFNVKTGGLGESFLMNAVERSWQNLPSRLQIYSSKDRIIYYVKGWSLNEILNKINKSGIVSSNKWIEARKEFLEKL